MRDYYDVMELPVTATQEDIRTKYRQLVRIYHPDRFVNPVDKAYAEEKLKRLNEAYTALTVAPAQPVFGETTKVRPAPVLTPEMVDFGVIPLPRTMRALIQASNQGGAAQNVIVTYSSGQNWLTATLDEAPTDDRAQSWAIDVTVATHAIEVGQHLLGFVEINLDGVTARTIVRAEVGAAVRRHISPVLIMFGSLAILLIIALSVVLSLLQ